MKEWIANLLKGFLLVAMFWPMLLAHGQTAEAEANAEAEAARAEAREELAEAREDLAEAARRMAEMQNEYGQFITEMEIETSVAPKPGRAVLGVVLGQFDDDRGVQVIALTPGGAAREAGVRRGDRLVAINGEPVGERGPDAAVADLFPEDLEPGDVVDLTVQRDGGQLELEIAVEARAGGHHRHVEIRRLMEEMGEEMAHIRIPRPDAPTIHMHEIMRDPLAGMWDRGWPLGSRTQLTNNHDGLAAYFGTGEGVLVLRIDDDNALGLRSGDVILRANGETVERPADLGRLFIDAEAGAEVTLDIVREGREETVTGTVPDERMGALRMPRAPRPPKAPSPPAAPPADGTRM